MAKRNRELNSREPDPVPNTSLQNHPLNFLIPTDMVVPFTLPHDTNIPSDTILFSQDDFNEQRIEESILTSDLWKLEDPDLKYVKFKKPYINNYITYNLSPEVEVNQNLLRTYDDINPSLMNIEPITKKDYLKINVPVQDYQLTTSLNDESELVDKIIDLFAVDIKDENSTNGSEIENGKSNIEIPANKPEFSYDSKVTQTVLISQVKNEFIVLIAKLSKTLEPDEKSKRNTKYGDDDDDNDDDLYNKYTIIGSREMIIARSDILGILKSKLINIVDSKTSESINIEIFSQLHNYCVSVIKESLLIEWEHIYEFEEIYDTNEYHDFAETVFQSCSILIILYANNLIETISSGENGLTLIIDVISTFGSTFKLLYKKETFAEIPDFFIPTLTQFGQMLIFLKTNFQKLPFNESLITKLEYVSFDFIFVDIIVNKERLKLNSVLEDLRALFANILILIYFKYEDQRLFLLNEIVENITTLTPLKSKARNYRLKSGMSIQLTSYLIISFLQCHHSFGKDFDFLQWELLSMNCSTKAKSLQLKEIEDNYWNSIEEQLTLLNKTTNSFVQSFCRKIVTAYSPNLKKIVENFISDFIVMLDMPEFPVATVLLNSIIKVSFQLCENIESSSTTSYALFFEIIGIAASKILLIKHESKTHILTSDMKTSEFCDIADKYFTMLSYNKFSNSANDSMVAFNLLSLLYLSKLKQMELEINSLIHSEKDILIGDKLKEKKKLLSQIKLQISAIIELPFQNKSPVDFELLTETKIYEIQKSIILSRGLLSRYDDILKFIVTSLNNPKIKSRALAVKNLTLLINKEPTLLEDTTLRNIIKQRLNEQSATVIDSILDLLLKILECKPEFIAEYYDIIAQKITDPSINVKKKSIGLIRFMFLHTDENKIKVKLCQALLSQLDDEEDRIIDLACMKLCELLFLNLKRDADEKNLISTEVETDKTTFILAGLFSLGTMTWNLFERFLNEKVIYQSHFNKNFSKELLVSLPLLVNSMLSLITDSNDKLDDMKDVSTESIMGVLSTFVKFDQALISQHQLISLQPYIIDNYSSTNICFYALRILNLALDHHKTLNKIFIGYCKESIMKRLTKFNSKELDQAVQCAWKLFSIDGDTTCISRACVSAVRLLLSSMEQLQHPSKTVQVDPVIPRLLFLIGNFGRYCKFENDRNLFTSAKIGLNDKEPIPVLLLKYLLKFCDASIPKHIRKLAIKNTLNICISYPRLFFSVPVASLIESSFKEKDLEITNIIIGAFLVFLEDEESRMIKKNGLDSKRSNNIKLDIAIFHGYSLEYINDGICSTLVQKYIHPILETCLEEDIANSINSIKFLRMVLKFGFSNPKICFPTVVALECAKSNYIRHIAIELHRFLFDKFETLIESTYSEALKTTVKYVTTVYNLDELDACKKFLRTFMKIVRERQSRQSIEKFIGTVIRSLGNISLHKLQKMNKKELKTMEFQVIFLCININEIEFSSQIEILTVVNCIEKLMLAEENIFGDRFNLLMDMFDDEEDEKLKYLVMAKALLCLNCLARCLLTNYSISSELILRFQESTDRKDFRTVICRNEFSRFFKGEIKDLLTKNAPNQLTLLHSKLIEFGKN